MTEKKLCTLRVQFFNWKHHTARLSGMRVLLRRVKKVTPKRYYFEDGWSTWEEKDYIEGRGELVFETSDPKAARSRAEAVMHERVEERGYMLRAIERLKDELTEFDDETRLLMYRAAADDG